VDAIWCARACPCQDRVVIPRMPPACPAFRRFTIGRLSWSRRYRTIPTLMVFSAPRRLADDGAATRLLAHEVVRFAGETIPPCGDVARPRENARGDSVEYDVCPRWGRSAGSVKRGHQRYGPIRPTTSWRR